MERSGSIAFRLRRRPAFPFVDPDAADEYVAYGGALSPEWITEAYVHGFFPFFAFRVEGLKWCCPTDRFVIFPKEIHVSHSMRTLMKGGKYRVTFNEAFGKVIRSCSALRIGERYAWLGPDMIEAYTELNRLGIARSVEVWEGENLVGGLYGLRIGNVFYGESMFSLAPSASKLALIALARSMELDGGVMIDCQYETAHLLTMGGRHISYDEYMRNIGWEQVRDGQ